MLQLNRAISISREEIPAPPVAELPPPKIVTAPSAWDRSLHVPA